MTDPTDPRTEARALIERTDKATSGNNWWRVSSGHHLNMCEELRDALEAALEREERVATAARNYIRAYNADTENFPHGYSEADALDALVKALEG